MLNLQRSQGNILNYAKQVRAKFTNYFVNEGRVSWQAILAYPLQIYDGRRMLKLVLNMKVEKFTLSNIFPTPHEIPSPRRFKKETEVQAYVAVKKSPLHID
ncbi:hypothetical protein EVAR_3391_1 [Eumeta japonica]|uniref:Uncharacterized protein n=1 Tax=Eumeta variegata TaxID=151549 RepID=A0A4C1SSW6_EUMVA|nr:hypothetical protein EVAR_3391_1 [Eumeta japonica]